MQLPHKKPPYIARRPKIKLFNVVEIEIEGKKSKTNKTHSQDGLHNLILICYVHTLKTRRKKNWW
jgi:hypothetical protein